MRGESSPSRASFRSIPPPPSSRPGKAAASLIERLAAWQARSPWMAVFVVGILSLVGARLASQLELRTRYDQLLPESQPSVLELKRVTAGTSAAQSVMIVLEGLDTPSLRSFGDALVPEIERIGGGEVAYAEDGILRARAYLEPRAGLFGKLGELKKLSADVDARWDWEVSHAAGTALDDDDPPPPIDEAQLKKRFGADGKQDRFPDGYYQSPDGKALVVVVRVPIPAGDLSSSQQALVHIKQAAGRVQAAAPGRAAARVSYAGDLVTSLYEYGAVKSDLLEVGGTGVVLVLAVVLLYFARVRALVVMAITILSGLAVTFGLTRLVIGHVNVATGFLFSVVAGNGINVGILYLARYYEERRSGRSAAEAILLTHKSTWQSTLVAAVTSAAAYMSLSVTDFRAFKHFAFIGAAGMVACWLVTIALLPALLILVDAKTDYSAPSAPLGLIRRVRARGVSYGHIFSVIVPKAPVAVVVVGVLLAVAGAAAATRYAASDPMEYDLRKVQNARSGAESQSIYRATDIASAILGEYKNAMVVLAETPEQARELKVALDARWEAAPANAKPFEGVHTLFDFVPDDQAAKLPVLLDIAERMRHARDKGWVKDADWKQIAPILPPGDLKPFGIAELPEDVARSFTDKSGQRGTLVLIQPTVAADDDDLRYLIRYADSFRETRLPGGAVVRGSGRAVVFADILKAVTSDIPKAVALSLVMTFLTVFLTFRRGMQSLSVLLALFVGLAGVSVYLYCAHIRINFLNFAALPITFGIGVDYAVNLMQRYHADGRKKIQDALSTTGGAVVLCSLTTILGYLALIASHNQAIRSLGALAVVGEICCLLAAVLVLPAGWYLVEQREAAKRRDLLVAPPPPPEVL